MNKETRQLLENQYAIMAVLLLVVDSVVPTNLFEARQKAIIALKANLAASDIVLEEKKNE